ncbi:ABC transporter permease [Ornithinimicrobium sp. Y1847]|uniref:ABC transporter permease n=1 Tax=Ornithinimicrobium sp. Y1847 TaxID=3405419 RepID=UPI003B66FDA2
MNHPFTGTGHLIRLILRRDRIRLPLWIFGITATVGFSAGAVQDFYKTPEQIASYAQTIESSASARLFGGVPYDLDNLGGITAYEVTAVATIALALMVIFFVIRHTRGEEEAGTSELVRSAVIGRHAATLATLVVALGCVAIVGALDAAVLTAVGLPAADSVAHGVALAASGLVFTGVAALSAQVVSSARGALALAGTVLGVFFVGRGWAAGERSDLVWLSPMAWQEGVRPFGETRWWLLIPLLALAALLLLIAGTLTARRDFGAGLVHPRKGRARAVRFTTTPVGLALRTQRGLVIGWAAGLFVLGAVYGSFSQDISTMVEANPEILDVLGGETSDLVRSYYAFVISFTAIMATAFTITSALRLRHDERAGLAESILATGVSRTRWALAAITVAIVASALMMLLIGLGSALTHLATTGDGELFWPIVGAALSYVPAAVLLVGLVVLLHGWAPRFAPVVWVVFAFALLQSYLGEILNLPDWVSAISPFWHLPLVPSEPFAVAPGAVLAGAGLVGIGLGLVGLRRRDVS